MPGTCLRRSGSAGRRRCCRRAEPRSTARDRDQEAAWCSDFGELQKAVAQAEGGIEIERALGVGAQAVKTVAFEGMVGDTNADIARPLERRL